MSIVAQSLERGKGCCGGLATRASSRQHPGHLHCPGCWLVQDKMKEAVEAGLMSAEQVGGSILGQRCWVRWPYLQEALVDAISDRTTKVCSMSCKGGSSMHYAICEFFGQVAVGALFRGAAGVSPDTPVKNSIKLTSYEGFFAARSAAVTQS